MYKSLTAMFSLLAFSMAAEAHQIWIEPAGQGNVIRFGEFPENLRETSPGALDKLGTPSATLISGKGEKTAEGSRTDTGFTLPFKAGKGETIAAEAAQYPLYSFKKDGKELTNWYLPAARLITGFAALEPKLKLDLVPTGKAGEFRLYFEGKALPKKKVVLFTQSGWAKEKHTDDQGVVQFDMPWKGTYVAEVSHDGHTPGERQGPKGPEKYDGVNYVTTLTYVKPDGVKPIPAGPAAEPHK